MSLDDLADAQFRLEGGWIPGLSDASYFPLNGDHVDLHQRETYAALSKGASCILNSNPTGAGKTLSWAAPVLRRDPSTPDLVLATYPTAALLEDQRTTLLEYLRRYFGAETESGNETTNYELVANSGSSGRISDGTNTVELADLVPTVSVTVDPTTPSTEQLDAATEAVLNADAAGLPAIVLTTPDTLTLLATNRFRSRDVNRLVQLLDAVIVDEFHLATDRARRLLPFHLDHYRTLAGRYLKSFVFLSATPHPSYIDRLERAFDVTKVTNDVAASGVDSARQILPETTLGVASRSRFTNGRWLSDHVDALAAFHKPPGQLLVIVDSVREVERITETLEQDTDLSVGRVYGWKREGRQAAIRESDVVVGNTAVEVGIDFDRVNRLVCTGYEPAGTLQRIGRMRYRSAFEDYRTLLITRPGIQTALAEAATDEVLDRPTFDRALHDTGDTVERPYYDVLCGAYTWFLWNEADRPLETMYVDKEDWFATIAAEHFEAGVRTFFDDDFEDFWTQMAELAGIDRLGPVFEELHSYRPSSLSCVVLDIQDSEERVKSYGLHHVLRHREGKVVSLAQVTDQFKQCFDRSPDPEERALLDRWSTYAVAAFVATGRRTDPREYYLRDFTELYNLKRRVRREGPQWGLTTLSDPEIRTRPSVSGLDEIDFDDEEILIQYTKTDPETARRRFDLGPYAAVVLTQDGDGCLLLWDDAIKAHCRLVRNAQDER